MIVYEPTKQVFVEDVIQDKIEEYRFKIDMSHLQ